MITKKKIRNWDTIKNNDGKYNSVMDEINRNYTISKKIKSSLPINELFKKILVGLHQSFNINKKIDNGLKFSSNAKIKNSSVTIKYTIDKYIENDFISIIWTNSKDKYWTDFQFKDMKNYSVLIYTESVLREDTISGIQGTIDTTFYKRSYKKNYKKWSYVINKTESDITEILDKARSIDKYADEIQNSDEYKNSLNIFNKFKGKKNISENELKQFKSSRNKIKKLDKKIDKFRFKANSIRYSVFVLEDRWIEFVDKNYKIKKGQ